MRHFLTYAGKDSTDFGIYISGAGTFDAPERDTKSISIPGRNGDLTLDNGRYKNIRVEYPIGYARNFKINAEAIRNFFLSFTEAEAKPKKQRKPRTKKVQAEPVVDVAPVYSGAESAELIAFL